MGKFTRIDSGQLKQFDEAGGSSGPGFTAALNLILLNTAANSYAADKTDNYNAEVSVGDWVAYADAAATSPVDMTGGSPNTTITRDTGSPINGAGSFLMTISSGASRQGEGVSCVVNIPPAYRGRSVQFKFPFSTTGTLVENDFRLFAYDITNSALITPYTSGKILGSSGMAVAVFPVPTNCAQLRVGLHIARTTTGAATIEFDDVVLTSDSTPVGMAGSDWQDATGLFTFGGLGTVVNDKKYYRRVGDSLQVRGNVVQGTASGTASIDLTSLRIDLAKHSNSSSGQIVGTFNCTDDSSTQDLYGTALRSGVLFIDTNNNNVFFANRTSTTGLTRISGGVVNNGQEFTYEFTIPIAGWSSNVSMAESSTFLISSYLANGTRVTGSAPTRLGEYRSYLRNASARTYTETNAAPTDAPSATNGIRIYRGNAYTSADTNNEPSKYDIFVGKNKNVKVQFYSSTGRTGIFDTTPGLYEGAGIEYGAVSQYDPTTGIVTVLLPRIKGVATNYAGIDNGDFGTIDPYFDIQVSENALAVGTQQPRSEVIVTTGNGHGSTNTRIRRFTTTEKSVGSAITYTDSATNGASFTINEDGIYAVVYSDKHTGTDFFGISYNSNQLTTTINDITSANRKAICLSQAGEVNTCSATFLCVAGDVIRPHTAGTMSDGTGRVRFSIVKVSN